MQVKSKETKETESSSVRGLQLCTETYNRGDDSSSAESVNCTTDGKNIQDDRIFFKGTKMFFRKTEKSPIGKRAQKTLMC